MIERHYPMNLPTREDINVYDSLDEKSACHHFFGKSLDEAEAMFRESFGYLEDLRWMGPVAFRFYVHAAIRYVKSDAATEDSDTINSLTSTFRFWLAGGEAQQLQPVAGVLEGFCKYVADHIKRFDVNVEIYGDLTEEYNELTRAFAQLSEAKPRDD